MAASSKIGRDTDLRLIAQRAGATVEISDPAQRVVCELAAELLDARKALRAAYDCSFECTEPGPQCTAMDQVEKVLFGQ